jgi:hypothetical protein
MVLPRRENCSNYGERAETDLAQAAGYRHRSEDAAGQQSAEAGCKGEVPCVGTTVSYGKRQDREHESARCCDAGKRQRGDPRSGCTGDDGRDGRTCDTRHVVGQRVRTERTRQRRIWHQRRELTGQASGEAWTAAAAEQQHRYHHRQRDAPKQECDGRQGCGEPDDRGGQHPSRLAGPIRQQADRRCCDYLRDEQSSEEKTTKSGAAATLQSDQHERDSSTFVSQPDQHGRYQIAAQPPVPERGATCIIQSVAATLAIRFSGVSKFRCTMADVPG